MSRNIATKVTDMMADWAKKDADAQAEAVTRLGLPANNTAKDRAKAMGFSDETYYHGTSHDFDEFNDVTTYVSPSPELATDFAFMDNAGGYALEGVELTDDMLTNRRVLGGYSKPNIMPLKVRASNTFDYTNPSHIDEISPRVAIAPIERIKGGKYADIEDAIPEIKRKDFDSALVKENESDGFASNVDNLAIFNPNGNIRNTLAHFNPKYAGIGGAGAVMSSNLMASNAEASPVTKVDDMLKAWVKADKEAQEEAVKRLGLPKNNTAQDRAKAMGFDTKNTWYRGDKTNLDSFDATNNDSSIKGNIFLSNEKGIARGYARGNQAKNYLKSADELNEADGFYSVLTKQSPNELKVNAKNSSWADIKVPKELKDVDTYDGTIQIDDLAEIANNRNYSSLQVDNVVDQFGKGKQKVIFDPSQLRSPLAHFNPKYAGVGAGSILSADLMADELDLEYKGQEPSTWDSLMNTISGVNQEQAQAYGDTGAGTMEGTANIAHLLATDPAVAGEVIGGGALSLAGATAPWIKGFGVGLLLDSGEASASPKYSDEDFINKLEGR